MIYLLCFCLIFLQATAQAASVKIPGFAGTVNVPQLTALPQLKNPAIPGIGISDVTSVTTPSSGSMIIRQNQPKAIIDWQSFDIGPQSSVVFDQKGNTSWVALNRIYSQEPSLIFGSLRADGQIYLINQNGIIFGPSIKIGAQVYPGAQVNVHTLIASALNMTNENFLNDALYKYGRNSLVFQLEDYQKRLGQELNPLAAVSNHGVINARDGGAVFLIAPRVDNAGLINAPLGHVGLIAGTSVTLAKPGAKDTGRSAYYVVIENDFNNPASPDSSFGRAVNLPGGELHANGGMAGMYGNNVDNWGLIRSITAFQNKRGEVELRAANKITTGTGSKIELPVDASLDEKGQIVTVNDTFDIQPVVKIQGLYQPDSIGADLNINTFAKQIEHGGIISAPTGVVTMKAQERVYLESGSSVDVSGVNAVLPFPYLTLKLNSVELRDAYGQKGGVLQGATITTTAELGAAIGDISQFILTQERTALERSSGGARSTSIDANTGVITYNNAQTGKIDIQSQGEIIFKQRATLDVSGGSIRYEGGSNASTKLVAGMKVYDIATAPLNLVYDKVLDSYKKKYERYGVSEDYTGYYYGSLSARGSGYTRGGDAGTISLSAPLMVLDGQIRAGATAGFYQRAWTVKGTMSAPDFDLAMALSYRRGLETPRAGSLTIDTRAATDSSIAISASATPLTDISFGTPLTTKTTGLSAKIINDAQLANLELKANNIISIAGDADIVLAPGGSFFAYSHRIEHQGKITAHSGRIELNISRDIASSGLAQPETIILGAQSKLDVSGERIDNRKAGGEGATVKYGQTAGGKISIHDATEYGAGVDIQKNATSRALIDVSGGYIIDTKGKITGGHAGVLDIQGSGINLDGDLRGYALADSGGKILGGAVTLRSDNILVSNTAPSIAGALVLTGSRLADAGFTQITLASRNDVIVEPGVVLETSLVRLNNPTSVLQNQATGGSTAVGDAVAGRPDIFRLKDDAAYMAGPSTIQLQAAQEFQEASSGLKGFLSIVDSSSNAQVVVPAGAEVRTAPAAVSVTRITNDGAATVKTGITLTGPQVTLAGKLTTPGGNVTMTATGTGASSGNLMISAGAAIFAQGYNRPDFSSTLKGFAMNYLPVAAGTVDLTAYNDVIIADGSEIDISGSSAVNTRISTVSGGAYAFREAGDPGSLTVSYGRDLTWDGNVNARSMATDLQGIKGGTLSISQTRANLNVRAADIRRYKNAGFDDITLKAFGAIQFKGTIDAATGAIGRKLTLGASQITGEGLDVSLSAPWIVLTNPNSAAGSLPAASAAGRLKLAAKEGWIDVIGDVNIGGFADVTLAAGHDIRLREAIYDNSNKQIKGLLSTTGNLTLDAGRVYPGSIYDYKNSGKDYSGYYSDSTGFVVSAGQKITVQNSFGPAAGGIYSAGGKLTIVAGDGIEVRAGGFVAAPLGSITLKSEGGRIYLAEGSTLSTAGTNNMPVKYGQIDDNNNWMVTSDPVNQSGLHAVDADSFSKEITLNAGATGTVIVRNGAQIDASGGGSVFGLKFQAGINGSVDPLLKNENNRFIVFKDKSFSLPGATVHLAGGAGLAEGTYTIIALNKDTAQYAFLPDAYILETQKGAALPVAGLQARTKEGYPLVYGFAGVAGTSISGTRPTVYSVRTAAEVIATEGDYIKPQLVSGNGGNFNITGKTIILEGNLKALPLSGYTGGKIDLIAANIVVQKLTGKSNLLPNDFDFSAALDPALENNLLLSYDSLSGKGFGEVVLGDKVNTSTVVLKAGTADDPAVLGASKITVAAKDKVTLESYTRLESLTAKGAASGEGVINLVTPAGALLIDDNATVHATHLISLDVNNVEGIRGKLQVEKSAIELKNANIYFGESTASTATGLHVTGDVWNLFSGFENISFVGKQDIQFLGDATLVAAASLTLDAAGILDMQTGKASLVNINAPVVNIRNSQAGSSNSTAGKSEENKGTFTVTADKINIGGGDVFFDGFKTLSLSATADAAFKGKGSLNTRNADLNIQAGRVITAAGGNSTKGYIAPNFTVNTGTGVINMSSIPNLSPADDSVAGGLLEMKGRNISLATILRSDGGTIKLTSGGADADGYGITIKEGGAILARGTSDGPGGQVTLSAAQGTMIALANSSLIDVSAGTQGDAGGMTLSAPAGVAVNGTLSGGAVNGGAGGSFTLYTKEFKYDTVNDIDQFHDLNNKLAQGGFNKMINIRLSTGDLNIGSRTTVAAKRVILTADGNDLNVYGKIDASGKDGGGRVELYAQNNVTLKNGGVINVSGTDAGAAGGGVLLNAASGYVDLQAGSTVNLPGNGGAGGRLYLRALRNGNDVKIKIDGAIAGSSAVYAEAVRIYSYAAAGGKSITAADMGTATTGYQGDTNSYMANALDSSLAGSAMNRLGQKAAGLNFTLMPGIEIRNTLGDLTLGADWDFSSKSGSSYVWRYGSDNSIPGVLTLRAAGNVNIANKLVDHPTAMASLTSSTAQHSWSFNLAAGADMTANTASANYLSVKPGTGDLAIAANKLVYTENAVINFASGRDTTIGSGNAAGYMINSDLKYNLASYNGDIRGYAGQDLIIGGGAIQTATGNIDLTVERDVQLNVSGSAIRTTGETTATATKIDQTTVSLLQQYWTYAHGGNVTLTAGRYIGQWVSVSQAWQTFSDSNAWDAFTQIKFRSSPTIINYGMFSANYTKGTSGIATMGGGNVYVRSGGDFLTQVGAFGTGGWDYSGVISEGSAWKGGNLSIYAGGDIDGRFLNMNGYGMISAMGNFGSSAAYHQQQIELFNSKMNVAALGEIQIAAIANPTLVDPNKKNTNSGSAIVEFLTYTPDTSISLKAGEDVILTGKSTLYTNPTYPTNITILPATVQVIAGGDITLGSDFILAPSPAGNLTLVAGGNISGTNTKTGNKIKMSDVDPSYLYGRLIYTGNPTSTPVMLLKSSNKHGYYLDSAMQSQSVPLHYYDSQRIEIIAQGDIRNLNMIFPKQAEVAAKGDILNVTYQGQNLHSSDVSKITAAGDISMAYVAASTSTDSTDLQKDDLLAGLVQGGPGVFLVGAGKSIDLGTLRDGIQTIGNGRYPQLGTGDSSLIILSGYQLFNKTADEVRTFFGAVQKAGDTYAQLSADGKLTDAAQLLAQTRLESITPFLGSPAGNGNINMTSSQITTSIGKSDIFVIAAGDLNLGKTALPASGKVSPKTGISTGGGGTINIFSANGDVNVNESRIMTFFSRDDIKARIAGLDTGKITEDIVSALANAKASPGSPVLENFLQASGLSADVQTKLLAVKKDVLAMGDITVWADQGNINAGRGSRTAVSASSPRVNDDGTQVFSPPAVGSGIRATTYGDKAPLGGTVHLFAPAGVIDAGEAEIAGGKIVLGGEQVVNVQNIISTSGSVGVSQASSGASSLGTLTGSGSATPGDQMASSAGGVNTAKMPGGAKMIDDVIAKWIDVKVIDYIIDLE